MSFAQATRESQGGRPGGGGGAAPEGTPRASDGFREEHRPLGSMMKRVTRNEREETGKWLSTDSTRGMSRTVSEDEWKRMTGQR